MEHSISPPTSPPVSRPRGIAQLRLLAREARLGAHSHSERLAGDLFYAHGLTGWTANFELVRDGIVLAVLDIAFPAFRLGIELDGRAWHTDRERFQHDRARQNWLVNEGWTVLRFTWEDLTDRPAHVIAEVSTALHRLRFNSALGGRN